jgi:hypothetical protein
LIALRNSAVTFPAIEVDAEAVELLCEVAADVAGVIADAVDECGLAAAGRTLVPIT